MNHYVYPVLNMGFTIKKYVVSISFFLTNWCFFGKIEGYQLRILSQNFKKFKIHKNLCNGPLCIIDMEYGLHGQKIRSFGQFLPQTGIFW
jgi:hypothetical protein